MYRDNRSLVHNANNVRFRLWLERDRHEFFDAASRRCGDDYMQEIVQTSAARVNESGFIDMTRPLCRYPETFAAAFCLFLRPDDHLADAVAVLARDCEGFIDQFDLPGVCEQRCKPLSMRFE